MKLLTSIVGVGCLLLSGCYSAFNMTSVNPQPNVIMPESKQTLALEIDSKVEDTVVFKKGSGTPVGLGIDVTIHEWKSSLQNGFKNAFGEYYKIVSDPKDADLIFKIQKAQADLVPAAVAAGGKTFTPGSVLVIRTQITYKVKLTDAKGNILKQSANAAESKSTSSKILIGTNSLQNQLPNNVKDAVESMYEAIVKDMFKE